MAKRKVTYKLYPNATQRETLYGMLRYHQSLYNAALQERRDAWKRCRVSITKASQEKQLTALKAEDASFGEINAQSQQVTLRRVDEAFKGFFRRVRKGQTPGYPRFKSLKRFRGWGYKKHGDGWRLTPGAKRRNGTLRISGVGDALRVRGRFRFEGEPKTMEVIHDRGAWIISVTFEAVVEREPGTEGLGFDWGTEHFLTLSTGEVVDNPRFLKTEAAHLRRLDLQASRKKRGSRNRRKAALRASRARQRVASRRRDFLHKTSAALIARASLLATETLQIKNMTASAKGTPELPGTNVRQKAGLNRSILDGAPATFLAMVRYKAEEAGVELVEVPARKVKPSQRCPQCGHLRKKTLSERRHRCECGASLHRDHASALVCLNWALEEVGNRPCVKADVGPPLKHETPPVAALAAQRV